MTQGETWQKKKNFSDLLNNKLLYPGIVIHINSSHDVKSESITEFDTCLSDTHIVLLSDAMESFPSLLTLLLCSVVTDLIICFQSLAFYDAFSQLIVFLGPFPLVVG